MAAENITGTELTNDMLIENIKRNLDSININYVDLKQGTKDWLLRIEREINNREQVIENSIQTLKGISFDITALAKGIGTTRQTLYTGHDGLLKKYIEIATADSSKANPLDIIEKVQKEKASLQKDNDLLMMHDVEVEVLTNQLDAMTIAKNKANEKFEKAHVKVLNLEKEVRELKKQLSLIQPNR